MLNVFTQPKNNNKKAAVLPLRKSTKIAIIALIIVGGLLPIFAIFRDIILTFICFYFAAHIEFFKFLFT